MGGQQRRPVSYKNQNLIMKHQIHSFLQGIRIYSTIIYIYFSVDEKLKSYFIQIKENLQKKRRTSPERTRQLFRQSNIGKGSTRIFHSIGIRIPFFSQAKKIEKKRKRLSIQVIISGRITRLKRHLSHINCYINQSNMNHNNE